MIFTSDPWLFDAQKGNFWRILPKINKNSIKSFQIVVLFKRICIFDVKFFIV